MKFKRILDIPVYDDKEEMWQSVIETPRGSRHKYKYITRHNVFCLKKTLPEGMTFPFDFGFLPQTLGEDGDPLDVLVLMQDGTFPGCVIPSRLIGVLEATQREGKGKPERNDRLLAIGHSDHEDRDVISAKDLDDQMLKELEEFFITYNRQEGRQFKVERVRGPKTAVDLVKEGMKLFKKNHPS